MTWFNKLMNFNVNASHYHFSSFFLWFRHFKGTGFNMRSDVLTVMSCDVKCTHRYMLTSVISPEGGDSVFLWNFFVYIQVYIVFQTRRTSSSTPDESYENHLQDSTAILVAVSERSRKCHHSVRSRGWISLHTLDNHLQNIQTFCYVNRKILRFWGNMAGKKCWHTWKNVFISWWDCFSNVTNFRIFFKFFD
jgi:hypothetical protein